MITGKDFAERVEAAERSAEHNRSELEQLQSRENKPFEYEDELKQAHEKLKEYSELMKKEMAEKEAKYAEMDASVDVAENITNIDDDDVLYRIDDMEIDNERFNEELERYQCGEMDKNEMFHLGNPNGVMRMFLPALPIVMRPRIINKATNTKHNVDASALVNLPQMLSHPIFIFKRSDSALGVLTEIKDRDGLNVCVAIELHKTIQSGGDFLEVNDVRSIHGRNTENLIKPIVHNNTLVYADKEKGLTWLSSASSNYQQEIDKQDLNTAANIVKNFENPQISDENLRSGEGTLTDDELSLANDPVAKLTGKSTRTSRQRREFAERERERMAGRVQELAEKLHLDNVDIVTDASTLNGRRARAKGFYSRSTRRITIVIPNHSSMFDVEQTLLHEAVAHYGLRQLFGEHFDTFLDNVYENAEEGIKARIDALSRRGRLSRRAATEEYLASLAENTNFENTNSSWWNKIKELFLRMLHKIGLEDFSGVTLSDNELRYILWRSYENLHEPDSRRSILGEVADIALQIRLGVGNYSIQESGTGQVAEGADALEKTNRRFNEELEQQVEGTLPQGHIYQLGLPGETLQAAGFPNLPIELLSTRLAEKAKQRNHEFEISDVKNLVQAINSPIAVFQYGDKNKAQNVIVETERDGKKFVVGVHFNQGRRGIIVNDIRGIFPKNNAEWLNWINQGKLLYVDKEKIQALISKQRTNLAEVEYLDLDSVANIIENFENPQFSGEESLFYRDGKVPSAREEYDAALRTVAFTVREANLDYMASAKIMMDAINRQEGKTTEPWEDAYTAENHLSSRNSADHEFFTRDYWLPLMEEVRHLCSQMERQGASHGQALEEVDDYLRIKHGLERNEKMASRGVERARQELEQAEESYAEQEDKDGALAQRVERARRALSKAEKEQKERDFSGLFRLVVEKGFITPRGQDETASDFKRRATAAALREAALFEEEYDGTEALFDRVRAATGWTLRKAYESGLIGRGQYERVRSMYDYYVPLRGWTEDTAEEVYGYSGRECNLNCVSKE